MFLVGNSDIFWNIEESTVQADLDVLAKFKELNTGHTGDMISILTMTRKINKE